MRQKTKVLFVCSHNSARSQMAQGWLNHLAGDRFEALSAGVEPGAVNPLSVKAMAEVGVDVSGHTAKGIDQYLGREQIAYLIVVCDKASESCPRIWPGVWERVNWSFEDPSAATGSEEQKLEVFRRVRDEIKAAIGQWLAEHAEAAGKA